jgi:hypothetical protein
VPNARSCVVEAWCGFYAKTHAISSDKDEGASIDTVELRDDMAGFTQKMVDELMLSTHIGRENGTHCWH